jgi:hypothetical protein
VASTVRYRLIDRDGLTIDSAVAFAPNLGWRVGDTVELGPRRRYVIVEIRPGDRDVEAVWVVDELP